MSDLGRKRKSSMARHERPHFRGPAQKQTVRKRPNSDIRLTIRPASICVPATDVDSFVERSDPRARRRACCAPRVPCA